MAALEVARACHRSNLEAPESEKLKFGFEAYSSDVLADSQIGKGR
jgi:hypothetical protein